MTEIFKGSFTQQEPIPEAGIAAALALLTRLPMRLPQAAMARGARAAWAYPLAGLTVGALGGVAGAAAEQHHHQCQERRHHEADGLLEAALDAAGDDVPYRLDKAVETRQVLGRAACRSSDPGEAEGLRWCKPVR